MEQGSLLLLGRPALCDEAGPVAVRPGRAQALLWYVGAHAGQALSRAELAGLLWEDADDGERRNRFNTLLSRLRDTLPLWPFVADAGTLALASTVAVDLVQFQRLSGEGAVSGAERRADLVEAVALCRGPFLQYFDASPSEAYEEWLTQARQVWEVRVLAAYERLVTLDEAEEAWPDLARHAEQALTIDPLRELFHRARMRALYELGDRAGALAQYETCRELLSRELGVPPHPSTVELATRLALRPGSAAKDVRRRPDATTPVASLPPLVGRDRLLEEVGGALRRAARDEGRVVLVSGEAGMGKTRLLAETVAALCGTQASRRDFEVALIGRCYEDAVSLPYAPLTGILSTALESVDVARLGNEVGFPEVARLLPDLSRRHPEASWTAATAPPTSPDDLYMALAKLLAALPRPLLIVLDDMHWADDATITFLAFLVHSPWARGLAILTSVRPEDLSGHALQFLGRLEEERLLARYELSALTAGDIAAIAAALLHNPDPGLAERVYTATRGNPFLVVELLRSLERTDQPPLSDDLPLPNTIQAMLKRRLERLSPEASALIYAVAVCFPPVSLEMARQVARLEDERALAALDELLRARLVIEESSTSDGWPGVSVVFAHELIRRVVTERMSATRRAYLHRRAYRALTRWAKQAPPPPYLAERLALHAAAAALWEEHSHWALAAAEAAERVAAHRTACRHLEAALGSLERLAPTRARRLQILDVRLRLALLGWTSTPDRSAYLVETVDREMSRLGARPYLDLMARQAERLMLRGRLEQAATVVQRLLPLARAAHRDGTLATGLLLVAQLRALAGDLPGSVDPFEESRVLFDRLGDVFGYAQAAGTLGSVLATMGEFSRADGLLADLEQRAKTLGHSLLQVLAGLHRLTFHVLAEEWREAVVSGRQALSILQNEAYHPYEYMISVFLALPMTRLGDAAGGLALAEHAVAMAPRLGLRILQDRAYAYWALLLLEAGRVGEAEAAAGAGLAVAREDGYRYGMAFNTRLLGQVASSRNQLSRAQDLIAEAHELFRQIGARPDAERCTELLNRLPARQSRSS